MCREVLTGQPHIGQSILMTVLRNGAATYLPEEEGREGKHADDERRDEVRALPSDDVLSRKRAGIRVWRGDWQNQEG